MNTPLPLLVSTTFVVLALWHVHMALGPMSGESGGVPSVEGKPLFVPSRSATLAVAVVLCLFAGLVAATAHLIEVGVSQVVLSVASYLLALGLLARAIGEFKYVGFFKRVRASKFARLDTLVYSPVCLALSAGVALVAYKHAI